MPIMGCSGATCWRPWRGSSTGLGNNGPNSRRGKQRPRKRARGPTGSAAAGQLFLGSTAAQTGFLNQSAGSLSVTDLTVAAHSESLFGGGALQVNGRFNLLGELDFNSGSATVTLADNGTLDFSRGLLQNAASTSIAAGRGTTIYSRSASTPTRPSVRSLTQGNTRVDGVQSAYDPPRPASHRR